MIPMGDDFGYFKANETFDFVEKFKEVFEKYTDKFEFKYSTPSLYMEALRKEAEERELEFPVYNDDFFPLLMQYPSHYWSGYFTSRPNFKKLIRDLTYQSFMSLFQYSSQLISNEDFKA